MVQSKYSIWARHIKNPRKVTKDEPLMDSVLWAARQFIDKEVYRATMKDLGYGAKKLVDSKVKITGIHRVDLHGHKIQNGSLTTYYPEVTFIGSTDLNGRVASGLNFSSDELYETTDFIAKESKRKCGGYAEAIERLAGCAKWEAKNLCETLRSFRTVMDEFKGRGWVGKRLFVDERLDKTFSKLMKILEDPDIYDVVKEG